MNDVRARPRGCEIRFNTIVRDLFPDRSVLFDKIWLQLNYSWMTNCVSYGANGAASFAFKSTAEFGISLEFHAAARRADDVVDIEAEINAQTARDQNNFFAEFLSLCLRGLRKWVLQLVNLTQRWRSLGGRQSCEIRAAFAVNKARVTTSVKSTDYDVAKVCGANESLDCSRTSSCRSSTQFPSGANSQPWLIAPHFVGEITLLAQSGDERQEIVWNLFHNSDS